ncbi:hypothetical protein [Streptomyces sp. NPDC001568]
MADARPYAWELDWSFPQLSALFVRPLPAIPLVPICGFLALGAAL